MIKKLRKRQLAQIAEMMEVKTTKEMVTVEKVVIKEVVIKEKATKATVIKATKAETANQKSKIP